MRSAVSRGPPLEVKVWGPFAYFTRLEMKVEGVSYPVMIPSAARGLEAICWKSEFSWEVREIWVLNEIRHFSIRRNEVNKKASIRGGECYADDPEVREQRHTLALRDVAYLIKADITLKPHADADIAKYRDMFRRRVNRRQCYHRPYLGIASFRLTSVLPTAGSDQLS